MLALVKTQKGKGFIELREVPEPTFTDDEVLIEVKAAGICGTDVHVLHDTNCHPHPISGQSGHRPGPRGGDDAHQQRPGFPAGVG